MSIESWRKYRSEHLEEIRAKDRIRGRARWLKNPGKMTAANKKCRLARRLFVLDAYGGKCACCGETRNEFLAIDHINGGGLKHRKEINRFGSEFYRWLKSNKCPTGFRVLCHNCNQSRGWYGYCPHEKAASQ